MTTTSTTGKRRRGFTLAEMLVVLAVIGIIAMVATPAFMAFTRHSRLNGAARIISTAFRTARGYAITLRVPRVPQVDLDKNAVQIYESPDVVKWYNLPENVDLWTADESPNSGRMNYKFMPDGSLDDTSGNPENLRVWENKGEAGRQRYVQIDFVSATGKVKVGDVITP